jgi:hypothetical protein
MDDVTILKEFCKWKATWKDFREQTTSECSDIRARLKQLRDDLMKAMTDDKLSIVRIAAASARTDDMPNYLRVAKTNSTRVIDIDTIKEIIDNIKIDDIRTKLSEGKSFADAVVDCLIDGIKYECTVQRRSIQLSASVERGTSALEVPVANAHIERLAIRLHETTKELRGMADAKKKELEEIESHLDELEPKIGSVLESKNWKTKRIRLETGMREPREFILRERESCTKSAWKIKDIQSMLPDLLSTSLAKYDHWNAKFVEDLKVKLELIWESREPKKKKTVCLDRCVERWD